MDAVSARYLFLVNMEYQESSKKRKTSLNQTIKFKLRAQNNHSAFLLDTLIFYKLNYNFNKFLIFNAIDTCSINLKLSFSRFNNLLAFEILYLTVFSC